MLSNGGLVMKTTLNVVFSLTGWLAISLFVVCGHANAQNECDIAVVENQLPGDNKAATNLADEFNEYANIHVVRAGSLQEMETNVLTKFSEEGCSCIRNLYIAGHGASGTVSVGNGQLGADVTRGIGTSNKTNWSRPLLSLAVQLCSSSTVWLVGCNVGHCQRAQDMLHEVAKHMETTVKGPVDKVYTYRKGHKEEGTGVIAYMQSGRWQTATQSVRPAHQSKSADDKAKTKDTAAGTEFYCPCDRSSYTALQGCVNGCETSLSCYVGICDPIYVNNTCDKYSGNPVLTGGTGVVLSPALLATSRDQKKTSDNLGSLVKRSVGKNPPNSTLESVAVQWDDYGLSQPTILKDGPVYRMWFAGYDSSDIARIGYATSTDGISWVKYSGNPVLKEGAAGSWDETQVYNPTVVKDGSTFKMWFTGYSTGAKYARIGYATSPDGITWTKHPTYVLDAGTFGAWDEGGVGECSVIKDGGTYKMWFAGSDSEQWWRTGYATSTDGIVWNKYSDNPILSEGAPGSWDEWAAAAPAVIKDGSTYHMLYGGINSSDAARIGYATSTDGKNWLKSPRNPLITEGLDSVWDNGNVFHATFFKDSNEEVFKIFYRGYSADTWAYTLGFSVTTNLSGLPPASCTVCSGDAVELTNVTFESGTNCECSATTSITIGTGVTIKSGANIIFKAPTVKIQSGFHAEQGAVMSVITKINMLIARLFDRQRSSRAKID